MKALVTGGAGYIGAHMVHFLANAGCDVVALDNLSTGHAEAVHKKARLWNVDLSCPGDWQQSVRDFNPDVVFHFAAKSIVSESCQRAWEYLSGNSQMVMHLISSLDPDHSVIVYSSSCSVYGSCSEIPISETTRMSPASPYAESKRIGETLVQSACSQLGFRACALRYFNVAGCLNAALRERHEPETHLIPNLLRSVVCRTPFSLYGTTHPTPDGTAIRDFVHVCDLVEAHLAAARRLADQTAGFFDAFNIGTGRGYSVREVLDRVKRITGSDIIVAEHEARPGDAPILIADNRKWNEWAGVPAQWRHLDDMIRSAMDAFEP